VLQSGTIGNWKSKTCQIFHKLVNILLSLMKTIWKLNSICQNYGKEHNGILCWLTVVKVCFFGSTCTKSKVTHRSTCLIWDVIASVNKPSPQPMTWLYTLCLGYRIISKDEMNKFCNRKITILQCRHNPQSRKRIIHFISHANNRMCMPQYSVR